MFFDSAYERGDYDHLYANYLGDGHGRLAVAVRDYCKEANPIIAVDLCAGTGHMTLHLFDCGLRLVVAVDKSQAMLDHIPHKLPPVYQATRRIEYETLNLDKPGSFEELRKPLLAFDGQGACIVTCRQGIGYLEANTLHLIPERLLAPGGSFLFNTFIEPPLMQPWMHHRGRGIYEAGFYYDSRVYHAQIRWPRLDFTTFHWHDVVKAHGPAWVKKGYGVEITRHHRTLIVKVKRPT